MSKIIINDLNYKCILSEKGNIIGHFTNNYTYDTTKWFNSLREAVHCYKQNINIQPLCKCGLPVKFGGSTKGYNKFCSISCARKYVGDTPEEDKIPLYKENLHNILTTSGKISHKYIKQYKIPDEIYWPSDIKGYVRCVQGNVHEHPKCKGCNEYLKYIDSSTHNTKYGYRSFCSTKCSNSNLEVSHKKLETFSNNVGVNILDREQNTTELYKGFQLQGFLYLIHSESLKKVKIGITINPEDRLRRIKKHVNDAYVYYQRKLNNVYIHEKNVHKIFMNDHTPLQEGDGKSEWFSDDILPIAVKIIQGLDN